MSGWKYFCCLCSSTDKQTEISYRRYSRAREKRGRNKRTSRNVTLTGKSLLDNERPGALQMIPLQIVEYKYKLPDENRGQGSGVRLLESPKSKKRRKIQDVFSEMPDGSHFRSDKIPRLENKPHYFLNNSNYHNQTRPTHSVSSGKTTKVDNSIMFSSLPTTGFKPYTSQTDKKNNIDSGFFVRSFSPNTSLSADGVSKNSTSGSREVLQNIGHEVALHSMESKRTSAYSGTPNSQKGPHDKESGANSSDPNPQHYRHGNPAQMNGVQRDFRNGQREMNHQRPVSANGQQAQPKPDSDHPALMRHVSPRTGMLSFPASRQNRKAHVQPKSKSDVGRQSSKPVIKPQKQMSMTHRDEDRGGKVESMYGYIPRAVQNVYASTALEGHKIDDFFLHCHNQREMERFASTDRLCVGKPVIRHENDITIELEKFELEDKSDKVPERLAAIFEPSRTLNGKDTTTNEDSAKLQSSGNSASTGNDVALGVSNMHIDDKEPRRDNAQSQALSNGHQEQTVETNMNLLDSRPESQQTTPALTPVASLSSFVLDMHSHSKVDLDKSLEVMWTAPAEVLY